MFNSYHERKVSFILLDGGIFEVIACIIYNLLDCSSLPDHLVRCFPLATFSFPDLAPFSVLALQSVHALWMLQTI